MIFQSSLNYIIDTFQMYAASGVAAVTFLRSVFAAVFPLFGPASMFAIPKTCDVSDLWLTSELLAVFHNLGIPWASILIALIAVVMIPIPFLYVYRHPTNRASVRAPISAPSNILC